jgi:hypothetical protein
VLFVVDTSGSNFGGNDGRAIATDPLKTYRYSTLKTFIDGHANNPQISYGFITFQATVAQALINNGGDPTQPIFTSDLPTVYKALTTFDQAVDQGATPYKASLQLASQAIATDLANGAAANTQYSVVFISDGAPTDYGDPVSTTSALTDVQTVFLSAPRVSVSTVYYGPEADQIDYSAVTLLQAMAKQGQGVFMDTNSSGSATALDSVVPLNTPIANVIKQFMVVNVTSAPCDDGTMDADSDADGLCDKDEISYNTVLANDPIEGPRMAGNIFDPVNRNSFGNIYSDYFNYLNVRYGQTLDLTCPTGLKATSPDLLTDCEKSAITSPSPSGPTPNWTAAMGKTADPG